MAAKKIKENIQRSLKKYMQSKLMKHKKTEAYLQFKKRC